MDLLRTSRRKRPMTRHLRQVAHTTALITVGFAFFIAGTAKAYSGESFAETIAAYRMFPDAASSLLAATLPGIEIIAALGLFHAGLRHASLLLLKLLTLAFLAVLTGAAARGLDPGCDCFGNLLPHVGVGQAILRDLVLLLLIFVAARAPGTHKKTAAPTPHPDFRLHACLRGPDPSLNGRAREEHRSPDRWRRPPARRRRRHSRRGHN